MKVSMETLSYLTETMDSLTASAIAYGRIGSMDIVLVVNDQTFRLKHDGDDWSVEDVQKLQKVKATRAVAEGTSTPSVKPYDQMSRAEKMRFTRALNASKGKES